MNPARLRAYFELLIVAVIWGVAGPVIKLTLKDLTPEVFLLYRFFLSSVLGIFLLLKFKAGRPKNLKIFLTTTLYAFLNSTAALGFLFWGTNETSLLDMSLISLFGPILMMIFGFFFLKEHLTKRMKIGSLITFLGATAIALEPLFSQGGGSTFFHQLFGNVLVFLSLICGATAGLLSKKLMREHVSPLFLANYSFLIGFITLTPVVLIINRPEVVVSMLTTADILDHVGVFYMAFLSGTLAYTLVNRAQRTIELSETAIFSYLYPIFSAILAVALLGEKITPVTIGACLVTFSGVFIAEFRKKRYN